MIDRHDTSRKADTRNVLRPPKPPRLQQMDNAVKQAAASADRFLIHSRRSRLHTETRNRKRNFIQKFFSNGVTGWLARSMAQSIPSPVGYGPGDLITGTSALIGKDVLSGEELDVLDRILYGVATIIPGVPATFLITPARFVRRLIEDAHYAAKNEG